MVKSKFCNCNILKKLVVSISDFMNDSVTENVKKLVFYKNPINLDALLNQPKLK